MNSSNLIILLSYYFNTHFPPQIRHLSYCDKRFSVYFQLIQARALWYQLSCHNCYYITIISKFVTANISFQRHEHTAWRRNCRYTCNQNQGAFFKTAEEGGGGSQSQHLCSVLRYTVRHVSVLAKIY
jgi:hypothetical protein